MAYVACVIQTLVRDITKVDMNSIFASSNSIVTFANDSAKHKKLLNALRIIHVASPIPIETVTNESANQILEQLLSQYEHAQQTINIHLPSNYQEILTGELNTAAFTRFAKGIISHFNKHVLVLFL
jgi:hypothetical protein